jgi:hypothetical protein
MVVINLALVLVLFLFEIRLFSPKYLLHPCMRLHAAMRELYEVFVQATAVIGHGMRRSIREGVGKSTLENKSMGVSFDIDDDDDAGE